MQPLSKLGSRSKDYLGVGKHRRLYVEAPAAYPVAAGDEGGAAVDTGLDVPQDLVELIAVDLTTRRKEKRFQGRGGAAETETEAPGRRR